MRQMCMCENAACPFHQGRDCDNPAEAKILWHGYKTGMCSHCLEVATKSDPANLQVLSPIVVAKLLRKNAQGTGNETFDRVWDDFHAAAKDPNNEGRSFHDMLEEQPAKHRLLIAIGKLNYMLENGGFERWIEEGYAYDTGDLLLAKLPTHDHAYPVLSKLHDLLGEVIDAYSEFGVKSYKDLERLLTGRHRYGPLRWSGPNRDTLWGWFKQEFKDKFRFRGGVTEPHDLEEISGKWGEIRLENEPVNQDLLDRYTAESTELEEELGAFPDLGKANKRQAAEREELMAHQADLDAITEAISYRLELQTEWKAFVAGGWAKDSEVELDELTGDYYEMVTLPTLVGESADLFNATPDEVGPVVHEGEFLAEEQETEELPQAA